FFGKYTAPVTGKLLFNYFGQAKVHSLADGTSTFAPQSYLNGPLDLNDLDNERPAYWAQTLLSGSSTQIRNEVTLVYRPVDAFNIVGGIDLRNGSVLTRGVEITDCTPDAATKTLTPQELAQRVAKVVSTANSGDLLDDPDVKDFNIRFFDLVS